MEAGDYVKETHDGNFACTWEGCTHKRNQWTSRQNAEKHVKATHLKDFSKDSYCNYCDFHTDMSGGVKTHQERVHAVVKGYGCNDCNMTWYQRQGHLESFHMGKMCLMRKPNEHPEKRLEGRTVTKVGDKVVATVTAAAKGRLVALLDSTPFAFERVAAEDLFTPQARDKGEAWLNSRITFMEGLRGFTEAGDALSKTSLDVLKRE